MGPALLRFPQHASTFSAAVIIWYIHVQFLRACRVVQPILHAHLQDVEVTCSQHVEKTRLLLNTVLAREALPTSNLRPVLVLR